MQQPSTLDTRDRTDRMTKAERSLRDYADALEDSDFQMGLADRRYLAFLIRHVLDERVLEGPNGAAPAADSGMAEQAG